MTWGSTSNRRDKPPRRADEGASWCHRTLRRMHAASCPVTGANRRGFGPQGPFFPALRRVFTEGGGRHSTADGSLGSPDFRYSSPSARWSYETGEVQNTANGAARQSGGGPLLHETKRVRSACEKHVSKIWRLWNNKSRWKCSTPRLTSRPSWSASPTWRGETAETDCAPFKTQR